MTSPPVSPTTPSPNSPPTYACPPMTIHRAIKAGHLTALRLGPGLKPTVRIPAADAHQWILTHLTTERNTR